MQLNYQQKYHQASPLSPAVRRVPSHLRGKSHLFVRSQISRANASGFELETSQGIEMSVDRCQWLVRQYSGMWHFIYPEQVLSSQSPPRSFPTLIRQDPANQPSSASSPAATSPLPKTPSQSSASTLSATHGSTSIVPISKQTGECARSPSQGAACL